MTRCKAIAIITLLSLAALVPLAAAPHDAAASTLRSRLQAARIRLSHARHHLRDARTALDAALIAATASTSTPEPSCSPEPTASTDSTPSPQSTPSLAVAAAAPSLGQLRAGVRHWQAVVRHRRSLVRRLSRAYRMQRHLAMWARSARWKPLIKYAAAKYHVDAGGIYRMMMRESGGRRFAGSGGTYKGLFQYCTTTWTANWNPWRHHSIFDAESQIFATCYAVHRGYGPSMWTTYSAAF